MNSESNYNHPGPDFINQDKVPEYNIEQTNSKFDRLAYVGNTYFSPSLELHEGEDGGVSRSITRMYNSGPNGSKRNVDTYTINADGSITRRLYTEPGDGDSTVYEQTYSQGNDDYGVELKYLNQHLDNLEEKLTSKLITKKFRQLLSNPILLNGYLAGWLIRNN